MPAPATRERGWPARLRARLGRVSVRYQLWAVFGLFVLAGACVLTLDEIADYQARQALLGMRDHSLQRLRLLKSVSDAYGLDVVDTTFRVRNHLIDWDEGLARVDAAMLRVERDWAGLEDMPRTVVQRELFGEVAVARVAGDQAVGQLRAILRARDIGALGVFADTVLYPAIDPVTTRIQQLSDVAMARADERVRETLRARERASVVRLAVSALGLLLAVLLGRAVLRDAYRGVESLTWLAHRMRGHDYTSPPPYRPRGELGTVLDAFLDMRGNVLEFETRLTGELHRNEQALAANQRLQDELRASEARARAASHAKSAFLAAMSHEIRTPMIGVTGMIEVLAHTRLDADQRHALGIIQQSSQTLLQIIGDILDFSKIEAERLELVPEPVRLPALLRSTVANYAGSASSKGLTLEARIDPRVAAAHLADPLRLRQILSNLLSNAIKFTGDGGITVVLEPAAADAAAGCQRLRLSVADTGIGMSAQARERLFQPFMQGEDDTTRRFGGTGLGLAICMRLAELMGGRIEVDSTEGAGTTMRLEVELPVAREQDVAEPVAPAASVAALRPRPLPDPATAEAERSLVLLVDDHPTNRLVIARQLALAGYASEAAEDGEQGLERWRSGRYALVLSDVHMPGLDGYQLAGAIRAEERRRGLAPTPIVALTASALKGEAERCLAAGMDDYLAKPVTMAGLLACLQRWLPHTATQDGPGDPPADTAPAPVLPQLGQPPVVLDPAVLATLTGGDAGEERAVLADFLDSTDADLAALDAARAAGDPGALARQAHRIKGAARLVGAVHLADAAAALEAQVRATPDADPAPLVAELHTAAERLRLWHARR